MNRRIAMALGVLLVAHFAWLAHYVVPAYASPDADGYFAQAELIAHKGDVTFRAESPLQLIGIHWLEKQDGSYISRYPPGLPIVLAMVWKLLGRVAVFYVNPLLATLTVLVVFLLTRPYAGDKLAFIAALIYAVNPLANYHSVHSDAHTASAFFLAAGVWLLDSWVRGGAWWRALGAGLLLGWVPVVRYGEAAAAVGVAVFLFFAWDRIKSRRGELGLLIAGAAIPVILLAAHNQVHFGAFWRTGYALTNEQQITLQSLLIKWHPYVTALLAGGLGIFFPIGLAGLAGMTAHRETRAFGAGLAAIVVAVTAVYSGYYFMPSPRFLLPTLPLYLPPAMWLFRQIPQRAVAVAALGFLFTVHLAYSLPDAASQLAQQRESSERAAGTLAWITAHVPAGSIVVADQRIYQCINFTGQWRLADAMFALGEQPQGPGAIPGEEGDQPTPMQRGKEAKLRVRYEGLGGQERLRAVRDDLWAWAGAAHQVYWIGAGWQLARWREMGGDAVEFDPAGKIALSDAVQGPPGLPPGMPFPPMGMPKGGMRPDGRMRGGFGGPGAGPSGTLEAFRLKRAN